MSATRPTGPIGSNGWAWLPGRSHSNGSSLADTAFAAAADRRMREKARALAVRVGAEDGIGASVLLLENEAAGAT